MKTTETPKKKMGRPRAYQDAKELESKISDYLSSCLDNKGKYKVPPTKYGLSRFLGLGFSTILEYEKSSDKEISQAIKEAKFAIEDAWVRKLWEPYPTGAIFYLKNAYKDRWRDRYDHTSDGKELMPAQIIVYSDNDRLKQVMDKRKK